MTAITERQLVLRQTSTTGGCVVYIMSREQRVHDNHALMSAQAAAMEQNIPLVVVFNLNSTHTVRAREHYAFMLSGLQEVAEELERYMIPLVLTSGPPYQSLLDTLHKLKPTHVFYDFNALPWVRKLQKQLAANYEANHIVVDGHNIVPVWHASVKQEFAAHTFRPKIHRSLRHYLIEPPQLHKQPLTFRPAVKSLTFHELHQLIEQIPSRQIALPFPAGPSAAAKHLEDFISNRLSHYATDRNNIALDAQSGLSPYLHFGHMSSLRVALEVLHAVGASPLLFEAARMPQADKAPSPKDGMDALFEELIVRKELADNFCLYSPDCTSLTAAPAWARQSLANHHHDPRDFIYSREQWEQAATHDPAWNAAQNQLRRTGKMHGYMRMYWAKKMLEWSTSPEQALADAIYLNDAYSIDGADPNGYTGILWSIAGLHDRPWSERPVFGNVRYMNSAGLKRKFDLDRYLADWS